MGMVLSGEISQGEVESGAEATLERDLRSFRCYQVLLLGGGGLKEMTLYVRDPRGRDVGRRATRSGEAAMRICTEQTGKFEMVVRAGPSGGKYSLSVWATQVSSCGAPITLSPLDAIERDDGGRAWTLEGTTAESEHNLVADCIPRSTAPEQIYMVNVEKPSRLRAEIETTYDGAIYLSRNCADEEADFVCNDDAGDIRHSLVSEIVPPGEYFVVVDGYGDESGDFQLNVDTVPTDALEERCAGAAVLQPGQTREVAAGSFDHFDAECLPRGGPEEVYRINLAERARVTVKRTAPAGDEGGMYIRHACAESAAATACGKTELSATLEPGTHYLFVEGGAVGLKLDAEAAPAPAQACGPNLEVPAAPANGHLRGSTVLDDAFQTFAPEGEAACASGAPGKDAVYHLHLDEDSTVRVMLMSEFDGALYLRQSCLSPESQKACNDDFGEARSLSTRHSFLFLEELPAGDYFIIVDAYERGAGGEFVLDIATSRRGHIPN